MIKWVIKYSRRGLLGEIFDKLRIQGRMHILGTNSILILKSKSTEELQVRIFTNLNFVKIRTYSSSVDSEFNIKELLLPKNCMRTWIRSLSNISPKSPLRDYLTLLSAPFYKIFIKKKPCGHIKGALLQNI